MKLTIALLATLFTLQAQAKLHEITCSYSYETFVSLDEMTDTFTVTGYEDGSGGVNFVSHIKNITAYFFPEDQYGAYWHKDSSFIFNAQLIGNKLRYSYLFNNYIRNKKKIETVYNETRYLDMTDHFDDDDLEFDYDDGRVTNSIINSDPWINNNHVQIESCKILKF